MRVEYSAVLAHFFVSQTDYLLHWIQNKASIFIEFELMSKTIMERLHLTLLSSLMNSKMIDLNWVSETYIIGFPLNYWIMWESIKQNTYCNTWPSCCVLFSFLFWTFCFLSKVNFHKPLKEFLPVTSLQSTDQSLNEAENRV